MSCVKSEGSQCRETPCIMVQREQRAGVRSGPACVWKSEVLTVPYSCTSKASTRRRQCRAAKTQKSIRALLHTKHKLMIGWEAFLGFVTLSAFVCKLRPSLASIPAAVQRPPAYRRCRANTAAHPWRGWAGKLHHHHAVGGTPQLGPGMHWHDSSVSTLRGRAVSEQLDIAAPRCTGWYRSQKSRRLFSEFSAYIIPILGFLGLILYLFVVNNGYLFEKKHYHYLF